MGIIPRSTKLKVKVVAGQSIQWLMGCVMVMMLAMSLSNQYVHAYLHVPFFIVSFILYVILQRPAPTNPTRPTWQCLVLWIFYWKSPKRLLSILGCAFEEKRHTRGNLSNTPKSSPIALRKGFALQ